MKKILFGAVALLAVAAVPAVAQDEQDAKPSIDFSKVAFDGEKLDQVLASQDDGAKARYEFRNPKETLEFFGIKPGMTVVELTPGGGWYSKILLPYLGKEGRLIGAAYGDPMMRAFSGGKTTERMWTFQQGFAQTTRDNYTTWGGETGAEAKAFIHGELPFDFHGTADAVLAIRAMHHLNRFDVKNFEQALEEYMLLLKPGGVVGVVQHEAPKGSDDKWANGDNGYLKKSLVIKRFEDAGFELVADSDLNANPKDKPTAEDGVWRLPPTLGTSQDDEELQEKMKAIGESNRMTLLFRKPA